MVTLAGLIVPLVIVLVVLAAAAILASLPAGMQLRYLQTLSGIGGVRTRRSSF
jgi:uncharacterized RDD family membrane protein YckC